MLTIYFNGSDYTQYQMSDSSNMYNTHLYSNTLTVGEIKQMLRLDNKVFREINTTLSMQMIPENQLHYPHVILLGCLIMSWLIIMGLVIYIIFNLYFQQHHKKQNHTNNELATIERRKVIQTPFDNNDQYHLTEMVRETNYLLNLNFICNIDFLHKE